MPRQCLFPGFRARALALALACILVSWRVFGQRQIDTRPAPLSPEEGLRQGAALIADLRARRPAEDSTNVGVLKVRSETGAERAVPIMFSIFSTPSNWVSLFETRPAKPDVEGERFTVVHKTPGPSEYLLSTGGGSGAPGAGAMKCEGEQTMAPFAGSDFWLADLGLEFLNWPHQRVLRKAMRQSQPCDVLESTPPGASSRGYSRVVSWIDPDNAAIIHADAYDTRGRLVKQFDPKTVKRVNGEERLEEIEMRNVQTGSRTWIKFAL